jgi:hypothetical protein
MLFHLIIFPNSSKYRKNRARHEAFFKMLTHFLVIEDNSRFSIHNAFVKRRGLVYIKVMAMGSKTSDDLGWLGYIILGVWIINGVLVSFLLTRIDSIVNGQLYGYGLQFSREWAEPYWTSLNLIYVFMGVPIALSSIVLALALRMRKQRLGYLIRRKTKPEMEVFVKVPETKVEGEAEKEQAMARQENDFVTEEPRIEQKQQEILPAEAAVEKHEPTTDNSLVISCPSCGKVFSRPLIMLDFSGGKTRLVNICPFCNHVLGEAFDEKKDGKDAK